MARQSASNVRLRQSVRKANPEANNEELREQDGKSDTSCDRGSAKVVGRAAGATQRFRTGLASVAPTALGIGMSALEELREWVCASGRDTTEGLSAWLKPCPSGAELGALKDSRPATARAGSIARPLAPFLGERDVDVRRGEGMAKEGVSILLRLEKLKGLCLQ